MCTVQCGLPLLNILTAAWPIISIDIKDCFFSIPLCAKDSKRFAFTLLSCNHEQPDLRYEWVMLPQIKANSPTPPLWEEFPKIICINYMDDILLAAKDLETLIKAYLELVKLLEICNLVIASEKVQRNTVINYLGAKIFPHTVIPQKIEIRKDNLRTLNDFQKLLGDINWIRCYLKLPNYELKPLYNILNGDSALDSPRQLTTEA